VSPNKKNATSTYNSKFKKENYYIINPNVMLFFFNNFCIKIFLMLKNVFTYKSNKIILKKYNFSSD